MSWSRRASAALLPVLLLLGCTDDAPAPRPSSLAVQVPLRQGDVVQPAPAVRAGHLLLDVLTARCGILSVTGTHAEFLPKDPLCRVRLRVVSDDATLHEFRTPPQRLVTASGRVLALSPDAMQIGRQPDAYPLGARNAVELDLWWTLPPGERAVAVRLSGDDDADVQGTAVAPATVRTVDVPLVLPGGGSS